MEYPYRPPEWKLRWRVYNGKRGSPHALTSPSSKTDAPTTATKTAPETALCDNQLKVANLIPLLCLQLLTPLHLRHLKSD